MSRSTSPQLDLVTLLPAGFLAERRLPVIACVPVPVFVWYSVGTRYVQEEDPDYEKRLHGITSDGLYVSAGTFCCERAPWHGKYLVRRGDGIRRRTALLVSILAVREQQSRPAVLADQKLLGSGFPSARELLSEYPGSGYEHDGSPVRQQ